MKPKKIATRWLILFFCLVAVLCAGLLIWGNQNASAGQIAVISVDGDVWQEADLSNVQESYLLTVPGGSNEILVEPGQISMHWANCPDQLCIKQGVISNGMYPIVCLPNRVVIEIKDEGSSAGIDGVIGR